MRRENGNRDPTNVGVHPIKMVQLFLLLSHVCLLRYIIYFKRNLTCDILRRFSCSGYGPTSFSRERVQGSFLKVLSNPSNSGSLGQWFTIFRHSSRMFLKKMVALHQSINHLQQFPSPKPIQGLSPGRIFEELPILRQLDMAVGTSW